MDDAQLLNVLVEMKKLTPFESYQRMPSHPQREVQDELVRLVTEKNKIVECTASNIPALPNSRVYTVKVLYVTPDFRVETKFIKYKRSRPEVDAAKE